MYTVLLVDDEPTVLETLTTTIHWQQYGVGSVITASDGFQALDILKSTSVDLLITDIRMPRMDGLSLLRTVRSSYPHTHCILLTAYSEFEYALQAIHLGADNYLLKPLDIPEMERSIEFALNNIYTSRKVSDHLFRENLFSRWAKGSISSNELAERASLLGINLYLPKYCVFVIYKKDPNISLSAYCGICLEKLSSSSEIHHFADELGRHVLIIGGCQIDTQQLCTAMTEEAAKIGISQSVGLSVGKIVSLSDDVPESYRSALTLLERSSHNDLGEPGLTIIQDEPASEQDEDNLTQKLNILFQGQDDEASSAPLEKLAQELVDQTQGQSGADIHALLEHSLYRLFAQEFPNQSGAQDQLSNRLRMIHFGSDPNALVSGILDMLKFSHLLYRYYVNNLNPLVQNALHHIHTNYSQSTSIQEYCLQAKISPPYLGYLFRKETGFFFNSYLTQYRICRSIPLLLDTDLKIHDIACQVGFSSSSYFITCFKQQMGLSPIKYRTNTR